MHTIEETAVSTLLLTTRLQAKAAFALFHFSHHLYGRKDKINQKQSVKCQPFIYLPHQRLNGRKKGVITINYEAHLMLICVKSLSIERVIISHPWHVFLGTSGASRTPLSK